MLGLDFSCILPVFSLPMSDLEKKCSSIVGYILVWLFHLIRKPVLPQQALNSIDFFTFCPQSLLLCRSLFQVVEWKAGLNPMGLIWWMLTAGSYPLEFSCVYPQAAWQPKHLSHFPRQHFVTFELKLRMLSIHLVQTQRSRKRVHPDWMVLNFHLKNYC